MRWMVSLLLPLVASLPQTVAAQELSYGFAFEAADSADDGSADRLVEIAPSTGDAPAVGYGPFLLVDDSHAALIGATDADTPAAFAAMLHDHPGIATLEMVDCPGTEDDRANLVLGELIHAKGIATHVPDNGWVASGAVDLFLAGTQRSAEPTARFAVHAWEDSSGRGPGDYAPDAPKNRAYLDYYRAVGMNDSEARAFYAMTNATSFEHPRMLTTNDMAAWTQLGGHAEAPAEPRGAFAQADTGQVLAAAF